MVGFALNHGAKIKPFGEKGFIIRFIRFQICNRQRFCNKSRIMLTTGCGSVPRHAFFSTYSDGDMPKCLRKTVEKWARLEKPTA